MIELTPDKALRRSPLYRRHLQLNAQFEQLGEALVVGAYGDTGMEPRLAVSLGLADLSCLPRTGFKGPGAPDWAATKGVEIPSAPNTALAQADGSMVAKLSHQELLIVSGMQGDSGLVDSLNQQIPGTGVYSLPRADSHSWLAVTGLLAAEMFSKICAIDLRTHKFAQGQVAQPPSPKLMALLCVRIWAPPPASIFSVILPLQNFSGTACWTPWRNIRASP